MTNLISACFKSGRRDDKQPSESDSRQQHLLMWNLTQNLSHSSQRGTACLLGMIFLVLSWLAIPTLAADTDSSTDTFATSLTDDSLPVPVVIGINGHYRVGHPTAVGWIDRLDSGEDSAAEGPLELETLDGDGVRVRFQSFSETVIRRAGNDAQGASGDVVRELGYIVPGSEAAPLIIRDPETGASLWETRLPLANVPSRGPAMIPPTMPWVLAIGDSLGVDTIGASTVLANKTARIAVTKIESASSLPANSMGFEGVDLVMINAAGIAVLEEMTQGQIDALTSWLKSGGRVLLCLGESVTEMKKIAPWLIDWVPVTEVSVARFDPAGFEMYTTSQNPLPEFSGIKLPRRVGKTLVAGRTVRRISSVQAARYVLGFGQVTVVAADLDRPEFAEWPERLGFVTQVVGDLFDESTGDRDTNDRSTSFRDLAGQMRGALDQFSIKNSFSFSAVSLVLMVLIALIGPLDYLLVNRVLGKPLLGWISFPLSAIALSIFLVSQAVPNVPVVNSSTSAVSLASEKRLSEPDVRSGGPGTEALIRANQFQVTDIDLISGFGRGFAWSSIYSHEALRLSVGYSPRARLAPLMAAQAEYSDALIYPMGYPGKVFGGIQLAGENSVFPPYQVIPESDGVAIESRISDLAFAPRSSKSIATQVLFTPDIESKIEVTRRPNSELLRGELRNPFPYDLLDGVLIYGNWVYLLPTRLPAGARLNQLTELRQKNFRWQLTRVGGDSEDSTETNPWSPGDFSSAEKIAQMMMFHRAAGGELYTGLRHDALGTLDLSEVLVDDRCILLGRTEQPLFQLNIRDQSVEGQEAVSCDGDVLSIVRIVIPVRSTRLN